MRSRHRRVGVLKNGWNRGLVFGRPVPPLGSPRNEMVCYDPILQENKPVSERVLVSEICPERILTVEFRQGLIDYYSSTGPKRFHQDLYSRSEERRVGK